VERVGAVDRALNLELLREALGDHERLPSPDELQTLLAQAEVNLFLGSTSDTTSLLNAGWYLHAVGGAASFIEQYPPLRRQRASQVAAHIFDVHLQGHEQSLSDYERLRYIVAAQYGYLTGDLAPNAAALLSRLPEAIPSLVGSPGLTSLTAAALLLGLDRRRLSDGLGLWSEELFDLQADWGDLVARASPSADNTPFGPALRVLEGISRLHQFLLSGAPGALSTASESFTRALQCPGGSGDTDSRWVAALLLDLGQHLGRSSVWSVLPPDKPALARALVLSDPPVLLFWPPQVNFLKGTPSPLDAQSRRQVLAFPTSAGKTLVSQVLIVNHLLGWSQP
jgi:hypothetical protein